MKKFICTMLTTALLSSPILADSVVNKKAEKVDVNVEVNGNKIDFDTQPVIVDGRTLLPIRTIVENIGGEVRWEQQTSTVFIEKDQILISTTIGSEELIVNGVSKKLEVAPILLDNRTLLPVRAIMEELGQNVDWDNSLRKIIIKKVFNEADTVTANEENKTSTVDDKIEEEEISSNFIEEERIKNEENKTSTVDDKIEKEEISSNFIEEERIKVVELVNKIRVEEGMDKLSHSFDLSEVADLKALDMATEEYFAHESPTLGSPSEMLKDNNIPYMFMGENIAMGQKTASDVMNSWLNSEGHRKNILSDNFGTIGVGIVEFSNTFYWVQIFTD